MNEPRIMRMDWKALGYNPVYKNGKLRWEKDNVEQQSVNQERKN
jgi:hypothetical protein